MTNVARRTADGERRTIRAYVDLGRPFTLVGQLTDAIDATGLDLPADVRLQQEKRDAV